MFEREASAAKQRQRLAVLEHHHVEAGAHGGVPDLAGLHATAVRMAQSPYFVADPSLPSDAGEPMAG
jgi:hypothetical protein